MGRNCQVYCKICLKTMRSDHLKRHMNIHEKNFKKEEKLENTIVKKERSGNVTSRNTTINQELLRKILMKDNDEYTKKINLGSSIYRIIRENKIKLESLRTVYKEALELFVKQRFVDLSIVFKKHKCDLCNEEFSNHGNLKRHKKSIHEGKSFLCEICGFKSARKDSLKRHFDKKHK